MDDREHFRAHMRRFRYGFLFGTEFVSYFILVPLLFLYILINIDFTDVQLALFIKLTAISVSISMATTHLNNILVFAPIADYFKKFESGAADDAAYARAQKRFFALPYLHSGGAIVRWLAGLLMVLVPLTILGKLTPMQTFNCWMMLFVAPPLGFVLHFLITEMFMQKLLDGGVFARIALKKITWQISMRARIIIAVLVIIVVPLVAIVGCFLLFLERHGISFTETGLLFRVGAIVLFAVIAAVSIAVPLIKSVRDRIRIISSFLTRVGRGDLSAEKRVMAVMDELTNINQTIYFMKKNITEMIGDIRAISEQLDVSSREISVITESFSGDTQSQSATMQEVTANISEISAGMSVVWLGAYEQFQSLESLAGKLQDLSDTIRDLERKIATAQGLAGDISSQARLGERSLEQMSGSMETITGSSRQMTGIIGIINDISDSINLLSLNASIEAARAGDAGRGFAVVADEISKLAENTAASVKEIDALIKANDREIRAGMSMVADVVDRISRIIAGVEGFNNMIESISQFVDKQVGVNEIIGAEIQKIKTRSEEIQANTNQQKDATSNITEAVTVINDLTQTISAGSEEIAANTRENARMADALKIKVDQFKIT